MLASFTAVFAVVAALVVRATADEDTIAVQFPSLCSCSPVFAPKMHVPSLPLVLSFLLHPQGAMQFCPHEMARHESTDDVVASVLSRAVLVVGYPEPRPAASHVGRFFVGGNWKMNGSTAVYKELLGKWKDQEVSAEVGACCYCYRPGLLWPFVLTRTESTAPCSLLESSTAFESPALVFEMTERCLRVFDKLPRPFSHRPAFAEVVIGVPAPYLSMVKSEMRPDFAVAAQNVLDKEKGAFTGEISPQMALDVGATYAFSHQLSRNPRIADVYRSLTAAPLLFCSS